MVIVLIKCPFNGVFTGMKLVQAMAIAGSDMLSDSNLPVEHRDFDG